MGLFKINQISPVINALKLDKIIKHLPMLRIPVTIFAYHRVRTITPDIKPYEKELISATPEQFEKQLRYLIKNYHLTTFKQLSEEYKRNPDYLPKNAVILTFDDGYEDFYTEVFPLLKKYNATAAVYPSTGYIGSSEVIWFDKLGYILDTLSTHQFSADRKSVV